RERHALVRGGPGHAQHGHDTLVLAGEEQLDAGAQHVALAGFGVERRTPRTWIGRRRAVRGRGRGPAEARQRGHEADQDGALALRAREPRPAVSHDPLAPAVPRHRGAHFGPTMRRARPDAPGLPGAESGLVKLPIVRTVPFMNQTTNLPEVLLRNSRSDWLS